MNRSAGSLRQSAAALVAPIDMIVKASSAWPEVEVAPSLGGHPSRARLLALMRGLPQILHIFIGFEDGNYFQIKAFSQLTAEQREPYQAPPGTVFIEDVILRAGKSHPLAVRRFLDQHGGTLATTTSEDPDYDPRTRPWYIAARETGEVVRTGVYVFAGDKIPGFSVSHRHNRGVVGVDITLTELGRFLDRRPRRPRASWPSFGNRGRSWPSGGPWRGRRCAARPGPARSGAEPPDRPGNGGPVVRGRVDRDRGRALGRPGHDHRTGRRRAREPVGGHAGGRDRGSHQPGVARHLDRVGADPAGEHPADLADLAPGLAADLAAGLGGRTRSGGSICPMCCRPPRWSRRSSRCSAPWRGCGAACAPSRSMCRRPW